MGGMRCTFVYSLLQQGSACQSQDTGFLKTPTKAVISPGPRGRWENLSLGLTLLNIFNQ